MQPADDTRSLNRRMQLAYDGIVETFAARNAQMPVIFVELGARFIELVGPSRVVLDAGCGAGRDLVWLREHGCTPVGLDLSRAMLLHCRRVGSHALVQGDLRKLPFSTGQFGGVWCAASLLHLPRVDGRPALEELRRVALTGAPLLLTVQEGDGERWERARYGSEERLFARYGQAELENLVRACDYRIHESHRGLVGPSRWLTVLAAGT